MKWLLDVTEMLYKKEVEAKNTWYRVHFCIFAFQEEVSAIKKKREYRKRKHKTSTSQPPNQNTNAQPLYNNNDHMGMLQSDLYSSDEDVLSPVSSYYL